MLRAKYQSDATDAVFEAFEAGDKAQKADVRISVCAPTGSGKTVMMMYIIKEMRAKAAKPAAKQAKGRSGRIMAWDDDGEFEVSDEEEEARKQVLILGQSVDIALQMKKEANRILRKDYKVNCSIDLEQGGSVADGDADLTIATWQGLNKSAERILKFQREKFGLVVVDECHHAASACFMRVLHYFNECIPLDEEVQPIKGARVETLQLIRAKRLSKMAYKSIDGGLDIKELLKSCNESEDDMVNWSPSIRENKLYEKCNAAIINEQQTLTSEGRRFTLVSVTRLRQLFSLKVAVEAVGITVDAVTGQTQKVKRERALAKFRQGETAVLIACGALVEGADLPCIDCILLARPTKSQILITQMIGRDMRISKETDKQDCLIVDFTVSAESGLKQFPELYRLVTDLGSAKVRAMNPTAKKLKVDRKQYQHDAMFDEAEEVPPTGDTDDAVVDPQKTAELIQAMLKLAEENAILDATSQSSGSTSATGSHDIELLDDQKGSDDS